MSSKYVYLQRNGGRAQAKNESTAFKSARVIFVDYVRERQEEYNIIKRMELEKKFTQYSAVKRKHLHSVAVEGANNEQAEKKDSRVGMLQNAQTIPVLATG